MFIKNFKINKFYMALTGSAEFSMIMNDQEVLQVAKGMTDIIHKRAEGNLQSLADSLDTSLSRLSQQNLDTLLNDVKAQRRAPTALGRWLSDYLTLPILLMDLGVDLEDGNRRKHYSLPKSQIDK